MSATELQRLTAEAAAALIRSGELSAADYREALLSRGDALQAELNAFISIDRTAASGGSPAGPLAGVPIAVKDNIVTRSLPTTCASRMLRNFVSPFDATAVRRLFSSGASVIGKTNMDEFAMGSSSERSFFGPVRNPWDLVRVAGGSSGGSAAAVAARIVPVALGSETGGSVRQPAAFCGVTGLKPTYGRISRSGLVAFASSLDQIGIFARAARDVAVVLGAVAGRDDADSTSSALPVPDYLERIEAGVEGVRFGFVRETVEALDRETRANFEAALEVLEGGGAIVEERSVAAIRHAVAVYSIVANAEASSNLARFDGIRYGHRSAEAGTLAELFARSRTEGFGEEVKRRIMLGTFALSAGYYDAYYSRAQKVRRLLRAQFAEAFATTDVLLTPTTPSAAFRLGEKLRDPLAMFLSDVFTAPANLVGIPALAIPSGFTPDGLPLSLQLMAPHFEEARLLRAARYFELETGYHSREPVLG